MIKKPFDELEVGEKQKTRGRTITESDVVHFCMLTGNWLEIHSNAEFSKKTEFGQRIVQGSLVFSIFPGLIESAPVIIAFYGVDKIRFVKPVFIEDTIYATTEVMEKVVKDDQRGVVVLQVNMYNQHDELVQTSIFKLLVRRQWLK